MRGSGDGIVLRPARPEEAEALSALSLRSKAVWGYDEAFLESCRAELAVTPQRIEGERVTVAERGGRPVGLSRVAIEPDGTAELMALFVEPALIGGGVGRLLFEALERDARAAGARRLCCDADPGAEGFYRRMGMRRIGERPSGSIAGRLLPWLEKPL